VLFVTGVLALLLGGLGLYGRHAVLDAGRFADRATGTLAQDEVRNEIAMRIADREIAQTPALAARRPVLEAAVADVVRGPAFASEFRSGAAALHRALFSDNSQVARFALPGVGSDLHAAVTARSAQTARVLQSEDPELMTLGGGRLESDLRRIAPWSRSAAALSPLALLVGLGLLAAVALRAPTRRRGLRRAALGLALAGGATVAATSVARAIVLSTFDTSHGDAVVGTIWSAFLGDLRLWGLAAGAVGLIAAAAFEPGPRGSWRRAAMRVLEPCGAAARLARASALLLLAGLLVWMPEIPLDLALVAGAGLLVFAAVAEVVRLAARTPVR
jgi:hypothetical protein